MHELPRYCDRRSVGSDRTRSLAKSQRNARSGCSLNVCKCVCMLYIWHCGRCVLFLYKCINYCKLSLLLYIYVHLDRTHDMPVFSTQTTDLQDIYTWKISREIQLTLHNIKCRYLPTQLQLYILYIYIVVCVHEFCETCSSFDCDFAFGA